MHPHFAVVDDAILALMDKFDRVFNGNDMVPAQAVGFINNSGQRCGFAAAGRPCHQYKAPRKLGQFGNYVGQSQLLTGLNFIGNFSKNRCHAVFLPEKIDTITGQIGHFIGKVDIAGFFELFDFVFRSNFIKKHFQGIIGKNIILNPLDIAANSDCRLLSGDKMKVGCALIVH